jgi:hypothetical protein
MHVLAVRVYPIQEVFSLKYKDTVLVLDSAGIPAVGLM